MPDWTVDEHKTVGGQSHFAEFVAGLTDAKDIKDAAVLTGALRALGTNCVNRGPSRWKMACSNSAGPECGYINAFLPGRRAALVGGYVKKRTDTPVDVLRLMRARLKEVEDEHKKSRARVARQKS
jgi:hypothetical protein